jgi:prevent-host-death family protein
MIMSLSPTLPVVAWQLHDAKAQFSTLVDNAMRGIPQHVTRRGKKAVVVVSEEDFANLQRKAYHAATVPRNLVDHLLAMPKDSSHPSPEHLTLHPRDIDFS